MFAKAMFSSSTIPVLEQVVNFAQSRHEVLAGNLANIDTPGYRVRDLSPEKFEASLKEAIRQRDREPVTAPGGAPYSASRYSESRYGGSIYGESKHSQPLGDRLAEVSEQASGIVYHDESNVSVEKQIAEISKNQSRHNLALAIMTSQFRLLQAAISERA